MNEEDIEFAENYTHDYLRMFGLDNESSERRENERKQSETGG